MARGGMPKLVQAKDVPSGPILAAVYDAADGQVGGGMVTNWALVAAVEAATGVLYPQKVVVAKCQAMLRQKLIWGCNCGCRGDWQLEEKGKQIIDFVDWELAMNGLDSDG